MGTGRLEITLEFTFQIQAVMAAIALGYDVAAPPQPLAPAGRGVVLPVPKAANDASSAARPGAGGGRSNDSAYSGRDGYADQYGGVFIGGAKSPRGELLEEMLRHMSMPDDATGRHIDVFV